jgi:hypothetical protein
LLHEAQCCAHISTQQLAHLPQRKQACTCKTVAACTCRSEVWPLLVWCSAVRCMQTGCKHMYAEDNDAVSTDAAGENRVICHVVGHQCIGHRTAVQYAGTAVQGSSTEEPLSATQSNRLFCASSPLCLGGPQ